MRHNTRRTQRWRTVTKVNTVRTVAPWRSDSPSQPHGHTVGWCRKNRRYCCWSDQPRSSVHERRREDRVTLLDLLGADWLNCCWPVCCAWRHNMEQEKAITVNKHWVSDYNSTGTSNGNRLKKYIQVTNTGN